MFVTHRKTLFAALAAFVVVLTLLAAPEAWAQVSCEDALRQAQKSYDLGLFEDVRAQAATCLTGSTSRRVAVEVHALIARADLNNDEPEKARKEISIVLGLDPSFDAGSSSRFAALVA
jgi:hypothetical protein